MNEGVEGIRTATFCVVGLAVDDDADGFWLYGKLFCKFLDRVVPNSNDSVNPFL